MYVCIVIDKNTYKYCLTLKFNKIMETKVIEIWKDVTGYEGYYQVSSLGNVRSLNYHKTGRVQNLKIQYCDKKRSSYVILFRDGVCAIKEINRLVYEAFIQEVDMNYDIIHIDGDYKNNILSNLKRSNKKCGLRNQAILCFDKKTMKIVGVYNSQREAARLTNVNVGNINRNLRNRTKSAGGYIWKYAFHRSLSNAA